MSGSIKTQNMMILAFVSFMAAQEFALGSVKNLGAVGYNIESLESRGSG